MPPNMKQASTLTTRLETQYLLSKDININWLQRLANDPSKSWAFFKRGLSIFCFGVIAVLIGAKVAPVMQISGLVLLVAYIPLGAT